MRHQLSQGWRRFGLAGLLHLNVIGSIPPLWLEIALLHFRGSFQSRWMWLPVVSLPLVLVGGVASTLLGSEQRSRSLFRPLAWLMTTVGAIGTCFHFRGIGRQMGGLYNWKYNFITGPPFPAPLQVALLGSVGAAASLPASAYETERLVYWVRLVNGLAYMLLAIEVGYNHWIGNYFNKIMVVPVILSPLLTLVHLAALLRFRLAGAVELPLSVVATGVGLVGFGFHLWNIGHRSGGFSWQNFFYGPPVVAPLQMTGQGLLGLLAALFQERR